MATFEQQVEDIIAEDIAGSDIAYTTTMLDTWLSDGAKNIINRLPKVLWESVAPSSITSVTNDSGSGFETPKIISVTRSDGNYDVLCREVPASFRGRVLDPDDMHYATATSPVFYRHLRKIYVKPAPTSSNNAEIALVTYPTIDASADSSIAGFPDDIEHLLVLYATAQVKLREAGKLRRSSQDELEAITTSGYLTSFESALPTYSAPAVPVLPAFTSLAAMTNAIPTYQDVTWNASFSDSISTKTVPAYIAPEAFTFSEATISDALTKAQNLIDNLGTTDLESYLSSDDVEMAELTIRGAAQEVNRTNSAIQNEIAQLREYEAEVRESLGLFTAKIDSFRAQFQEDIEIYRQGLEKYKVDLKKDVDTYAQENGMDATIFRAELEKVIREFTAQTNFEISEATVYINKYDSLVKGEVGDFQANLAKARSYLEEAGVRLQTMQNFDKKSTSALNEYLALMKQFDNGVDRYIGLNADGNSKRN